MTIDNIKPYERNAKKHDKKQVELLAKNIERFGFDQPIVLWRKTNEIIKGHGRYEAAKLLGLTECKEATIAKPGDKFIPVEFQDYADKKEANAARLADNQIHDMTGVDMKLVVDDLKDLPDDLLELTGFDSTIDPIVADEFELPSGDKPEYQQITFTLHDNQADLIKEALKAAQQQGVEPDSDNENSNGNAIYTICKHWFQQKT